MPELWFWLLTWMLGTYVVLAGADLGVGALLAAVARDRAEIDATLDAIRPFWKGNEVWLVTAGGTLLATYPTLMAVAFSGFYLPLTLVLWLLVFRNLGIELRHQVDDPLWRRFWEVAVGLGSTALIACLGLAFKPDIDDLRESPALGIVQALFRARAGRLLLVEPNISALPASLPPSPDLALVEAEEAIAKADIVVFLVNHKAFANLEAARFGDKIVVNACGWRR